MLSPWSQPVIAKMIQEDPMKPDKKPEKRKLELRKDFLKKLTREDLKRVAGGDEEADSVEARWCMCATSQE